MFQSYSINRSTSDQTDDEEDAYSRQCRPFHFADTGDGSAAVYRGDDSQDGNQGIGEKDQIKA